MYLEGINRCVCGLDGGCGELIGCMCRNTAQAMSNNGPTDQPSEQPKPKTEVRSSPHEILRH